MLLDRPIPELIKKQLDFFIRSDLHIQNINRFELTKYKDQLKKEGQAVLAIDFGGDKIVAQVYRVNQGQLTAEGQAKRLRAPEGEGYCAFLEELSKEADNNFLSVGISVSMRVLKGVILPTFFKEFQAKYNGDFKEIFSTQVVVYNDALAGLIAGVMEGDQQYPLMKSCIYIINGSGIGGAAYQNGELLALEPGHIQAVGELNKYHQSKECGMFGNNHTCLELIGGGKTGIEDLWLQEKGEKADGYKISKFYQQSDKLAADLYDSSALVVSHVVAGIRMALEIPSETSDLVIACHGGVFQVPGYGDRIRQILQKNWQKKPQVIFTKDFSENACLDGAAIAALVKG